MIEMVPPGILWPLMLAVLAMAVSVHFWLRHRRQSPQEKERLRRLGVHAIGRLADGELLDGPETPPSGNLIYYTYRAAGVEYTAAQDVSMLHDRIPPAYCHPGSTTSVKYDPRAPSNSIIICEEWSGLRNGAGHASRG